MDIAAVRLQAHARQNWCPVARTVDAILSLPMHSRFYALGFSGIIVGVTRITEEPPVPAGKTPSGGRFPRSLHFHSVFRHRGAPPSVLFLKMFLGGSRGDRQVP